MTEWVLIVMLCSRSCVPQYSVVYPSKAICQTHMVEPERFWKDKTTYCVPVLKEGQL